MNQPAQQQKVPGTEARLDPPADHGEESYVGHGRLEGRAAIVTGGDSGIGRAVAIAFAREGADVLVSYLCEDEDANETRRWVEEAGRRCVLVRGDIADAALCRSIVQQAVDEFGRIDILVNNAGIQHTALIEDFPTERWDAIIALNLSAVFHGTAAALPYMKKQGWGRIVNIASAHGLVASVQKSAYVAAKHGVVGLTKVTALETAGTGVTANAICPGWVRTALVERQIEALAQKDGIEIEAAARELLTEKQPSLDFVTPQQLGQAAVFLCSDAASQMTGAHLTLDGGWTAR